MNAIIKYSLLLSTTAFLFTACKDEEKEHAIEQVSVLNSSNDSLENALVTTLDEINQNLDMIRYKQGIILTSNNKENISKKQAILRDISIINALLESNKAKMEQLTAQSVKLGKERSALSRLAKQTQLRIERQEQEIISLKDQLSKASYQVADLNQKISEVQMSNELLTREKMQLSETNSQLDEELYKGYFIVGDHKNLKEKNLIEKTGGVLGIGKKDALTEAYNKNKMEFREIDIRESRAIAIEGKNPRLITFHPASTYEIVEDKDNNKRSTLNIKVPEEFWSSSKYLVVEVK